MGDHRAVYWSWAFAFHRNTALCVVLQTILSLPLFIRKELLGLCRTQSPPVQGSFAESALPSLKTTILAPSAPTKTLNATTYVSLSLGDFIDLYLTCFLNHLTASVIAHGLRIAPIFDSEEIPFIFHEAVSKELSAGVVQFAHPLLDFRPFFSSDFRHRRLSLCSRLPPSEEVASATYRTFMQLRLELSDRILFPRGGHKSVGRQVAEDFWKGYYHSGQTFKHVEPSNPEDPVSVDDCMRLYQETGGYPTGPVEIRTSFKYSQIGPRVYYARGGRVQLVSAYMQEVVNRIIDAFPEVHRKDRFSPPPSPLSPDDVEMIYDYSSFTSHLDAVVPFVDSLSNFFRGITVHLVDPLHGLVATDLGDLFQEYNRMCNQRADFDIARVFSPKDEDSTIFQHSCGMLGVEGNIFLATLLHGLFLRYFVGLNRSKCVGDDARAHVQTMDGKMSMSDRSYTFWVLTAIGVLNFDKIRVFEYGVDPVLQTFRYIKRPLFRDSDLMISGLLLALPSQIPLTGNLDDHHDTPHAANPCRIVFRQVLRYLDTLQVHSVTVDSDPSSVSYPIFIHLMLLRRMLRTRDSEGLQSEFGRSSYKTMYNLPPVELWGKKRCIDWYLSEIGYTEVVTLPKYGGAEEEGTCDGRAGSVMLREQSKGRGFLEKMGFVRSRMMMEDVSMESVGVDMFGQLMLGQYPPVMEYIVLRDVPTWYSMIPRTL